MDNQAFQLLLSRFDNQDKKFSELDLKVDELLAWKWKLAGATLVVSAIGGAVVQIIINTIGV